MGETVVLVTACARRTVVPGRDFFPLTVNYIEKTYAAGRIPGGSSSVRPTHRARDADLAADRPADPATVSGRFRQRGAVVATVISLNPDVDADIRRCWAHRRR